MRRASGWSRDADAGVPRTGAALERRRCPAKTATGAEPRTDEKLRNLGERKSEIMLARQERTRPSTRGQSPRASGSSYADTGTFAETGFGHQSLHRFDMERAAARRRGGAGYGDRREGWCFVLARLHRLRRHLSKPTPEDRNIMDRARRTARR